MRIAFTSCMNAVINPQQLVWQEIAAQGPQQLVLLGDSIYIDVPGAGGGVHPKELDPEPFMSLLLARYRAQIAVPGFAELVAAVPTHTVWDDHDFLWNESYKERAIRRRRHADQVLITRTFFRAWIAALQGRLQPGSFPASISDPRLNQLGAQPPGYRAQALGDGVLLHLPDGRSWRVDDDLLGADQRQQMQARIEQAPADTVHLVASGSVVEAEKGEAWSDFGADYAWLQEMARAHRVLVLSGDIHDNRADAIELGGNRWLFDATASGAAVARLVAFGEPLRCYGLVDIGADVVEARFFRRGAPDRPPLRIDRRTWQPL